MRNEYHGSARLVKVCYRCGMTTFLLLHIDVSDGYEGSSPDVTPTLRRFFDADTCADAFCKVTDFEVWTERVTIYDAETLDAVDPKTMPEIVSRCEARDAERRRRRDADAERHDRAELARLRKLYPENA